MKRYGAAPDGRHAKRSDIRHDVLRGRQIDVIARASNDGGVIEAEEREIETVTRGVTHRARDKERGTPRGDVGGWLRIGRRGFRAAAAG